MPLAAFSQLTSGVIISLLIIAYLAGLGLLAIKGQWMWLVFSVIPFPPLAVLGYILKPHGDHPGIKELYYDRERYWHQGKQDVRGSFWELITPKKKK